MIRALPLCLALGGCLSWHPADTPAPYIQLNAGIPILAGLAASATQLTPDIAATADHAALIVPTDTWDAPEPLDIAYFKSSQGKPVRAVDPVADEPVTGWCNSPWTFQPSAIRGRVIALLVRMRRSSEEPTLGFVFDASGHGGCSGGPVLNARGELVGIMTDTTRLDDGRDGTFAVWSIDAIKAAK